MKIRYCSNCGNEIKENKDRYYKVLDNFLQVKYFDSEDCNIFCSQNCLCEALSVEEFVFEKDNGDDAKYSEEGEEDEEASFA